MARRDMFSQPARATSFDNSTNGFESDNVQEAIEELNVSASPGFSFGRQGTLPTGTYLYRPGGVTSSTSGINVGLYNASLDTITITTSTTNAFTLEIIQHDGNLTNLTLIDTVVLAGGSLSYVVSSGQALTRNKQLAVRVSATSPNSGKDLGVDLQLKGSNTP